ncbi:MAG: glycosyltransferase [Ginsengibacter sp.]|jgi:GT2 family glycosyltransferase
MNIKLSIIIINFNVKYFLEHCLNSVLSALEGMEGEIIVVDNHSSDGSKTYFENRFTQVRFIWNETNIGFGKANNIGLKYATGEYILFLNPDTIVPEDCFEKCISFLQSKNNTGALGVKMIDGSGNFLKESKRSFPYPFTSLFKLTGLASLFPRSKVFAKYHLGNLDQNSNHEVDVLAGAFMMIPRKIINLVKGFDEDFFMYGEDVDLSYRIQQAGFKNYYFAETSIIHFKGESTKKGSLNYVKMFYSAMNIFVKKHSKNSRAGIFNLFIQIAIGFRAALATGFRFLKWVGMPFIDMLVIAGSFWFVKIIWSVYIKQEINYSPTVLLIALPVFTGLFLLTSWLTGLYDGYYKQSRLNKSTIVSILVIFSFYALLPESLRFSRGILLFGSLVAFGLMTTLRVFFQKWGILERIPKEDGLDQTLVIGTVPEYESALQLLEKSGLKVKPFGRIRTEENNNPHSLGNLDDLQNIIHEYPVKQIILCQGKLSSKEIISLLPSIPSKISVQFFTPKLKSIIGSSDRNEVGRILSEDVNDLNLNKTISRRGKRFLDVLVSIIFLFTFLLHLFLKKHFDTFLKNSVNVLLGKNTWVGFAGNDSRMPSIKPGIITSTGLPEKMNRIPLNSLNEADHLYALNYEVMNDIRLIWKNYRFLS